MSGNSIPKMTVIIPLIPDKHKKLHYKYQDFLKMSCKPNYNRCRKSKVQGDVSSLEDVVNRYFDVGNRTYYGEDWKKQFKSVGDCVFGRHNASYATIKDVTPSKRDDHQSCLKTETLLTFVRKVENNKPNLSNLNFDSAWQKVKSLPCPGIGPVTLYDTVLRLTTLDWNIPDPEYVYLHSVRGPLKGAKAYFKIMGIKEVDTPDGKVPVNKLASVCRVDISNFSKLIEIASSAFGINMDSKNVENLLCCHSDDLLKLTKRMPK